MLRSVARLCPSRNALAFRNFRHSSVQTQRHVFPKKTYFHGIPRYASYQASKSTVDPESHDLSTSEESHCASSTNEPSNEDGFEMEPSDEVEIDSEQLENVLSLLQSTPDESFVSSLENLDLTLNEPFLIQVFETPMLLSENLIKFFNWVCQTSDFSSVSNGVVRALVKAVKNGLGLRKSDADALWDSVKEIAAKDSENVLLDGVVLNEFIGLFLRLHDGERVLEVFNKFGEFKCQPDGVSYYLTVQALCENSLYDSACSVCEKMLDARSLPEDGEQIGQIISWLCKEKKSKVACSVYLIAKEENLCPAPSSIKFLISSLSKEGDKGVHLALEMLENLEGVVRKHAIKPFSAVVSSLCRNGELSGAKELLNKMIAQGPPPGNAIFNFVISGYAKAREMEKAMELKQLMEARGLKPNIYTYTVIISGYVNSGQLDTAYTILSEARKKHKKLNTVTYHPLIRGYCRNGEFDKALKLLKEMKQSGTKPNVDEYNKLIQSLCLKALDWEMAEKLMEEMKKSGLYLPGITRGLVSAVKELEKEAVQAQEISA